MQVPNPKKTLSADESVKECLQMKWFDARGPVGQWEYEVVRRAGIPEHGLPGSLAPTLRSAACARVRCDLAPPDGTATLVVGAAAAEERAAPRADVYDVFLSSNPYFVQ